MHPFFVVIVNIKHLRIQSIQTGPPKNLTIWKTRKWNGINQRHATKMKRQMEEETYIHIYARTHTQNICKQNAWQTCKHESTKETDAWLTSIELDKAVGMVRILLGLVHYSDQLPVSPAGFETFQLLHKKSFEQFCTLKEWCVIGVVIAAVVKDFGHVSHKFCQFMVMSLLQAGFHCGKIYKGEKDVNMHSSLPFSLAKIHSYPLAPW